MKPVHPGILIRENIEGLRSKGKDVTIEDVANALVELPQGPRQGDVLRFLDQRLQAFAALHDQIIVEPDLAVSRLRLGQRHEHDRP